MLGVIDAPLSIMLSRKIIIRLLSSADKCSAVHKLKIWKAWLQNNGTTYPITNATIKTLVFWSFETIIFNKNSIQLKSFYLNDSFFPQVLRDGQFSTLHPYDVRRSLGRLKWFLFKRYIKNINLMDTVVV